jgi:hypothetical protein
MLNIEKTLAGDQLVIGTHRIKPDKDGHFIVPRLSFSDDSLSVLQTGVTILVDSSKLPGLTENNPERVRAITVLPMGRAHVNADYFMCPCCWSHTMDFEKFSLAVVHLLENEAAVNSGFEFEGTYFNAKKEPIHHFSIEVGIGSIEDIERRVHDAITQILKPLNDLRDEMDVRMQQAFGL